MEKTLRRKRFENVAGRRVQAIIEKIANLGNCSNRNNYDFNEQDIKKMFNAVRTALKNSENRFMSELNKKGSNKFNF
jgi:hypothetical protein